MISFNDLIISGMIELFFLNLLVFSTIKATVYWSIGNTHVSSSTTQLSRSRSRIG